MKIVNKHTHIPTDKDVYVGRGSPLGNEYRVGKDGDRFHYIVAYAEWLWSQVVDGSPEIITALRQIHHDSVLVCYCRPKPCHAEIISSVWYWLESVDFFTVNRRKKLPLRSN